MKRRASGIAVVLTPLEDGRLDQRLLWPGECGIHCLDESAGNLDGSPSALWTLNVSPLQLIIRAIPRGVQVVQFGSHAGQICIAAVAQAAIDLSVGCSALADAKAAGTKQLPPRVECRVICPTDRRATRGSARSGRQLVGNCQEFPRVHWRSDQVYQKANSLPQIGRRGLNPAAGVRVLLGERLIHCRGQGDVDHDRLFPGFRVFLQRDVEPPYESEYFARNPHGRFELRKNVMSFAEPQHLRRQLNWAGDWGHGLTGEGLPSDPSLNRSIRRSPIQPGRNRAPRAWRMRTISLVRPACLDGTVKVRRNGE